ncbi:leucyl aminopeptidase [Psychrobacter sp. I-STPA10]|uniref:leucyl aminopeptidase n=1 Tax=Psychrobacter sp. I-STPA10 TaxID=2585769 RepID=UPI001E3AF7DE|nr:leucyl aminopeptidase [Psychrobacter sp. I-STPA10]
MKLSVIPTLTNKKSGTKKSDKNTNTEQNNCLVVLVNENKQPIGTTDLNKSLPAYQARIDNLITVAQFTGKLGESVADYALASDSKKAPLPLLLVGIGDSNKLSATNLQKIATAIYKAMSKRVTTLTIALSDALDTEQNTQFALALLNASYRFDKYKAESKADSLEQINVVSKSITQADIDYINAVFVGQTTTRNVANEPGNVCFPEYMAQQAQDMAKRYPELLKVSVLGEKEMQQLGMECFLAVAKGSAKEGKLVIMEYQGKSAAAITNTTNPNSLTANLKEAVTSKLPAAIGKNKAKAKSAKTDANSNDTDAPIVLVGKGVTFDSGGISIKPGAAMDEMKFDMGGSASVLGTMQALCEARLPINVVGALACAENMPSGDATRPGDIVKAMNGKTVEILNTDAEGRLVLADTLCYVQRYNPKVIIDVATLTGACIIALGHVRSAVYSNDEDVLFELENASEQSGDLIWHMPLDDAYQSQLDSPIADIQNIGGRPAGSVTAACFLKRFIKEGQAWAHLDIAGTAWNSGKEKGATGRPVPLFMQYLKNCSQC